MIVGISGNTISVYHTGVEERMRGHGLGKKLVEALVEHARANKQHVIIFCPFVKAIFNAQAAAYADIWTKDGK
jgi:predicted GNAT family acetyltransferase